MEYYGAYLQPVRLIESRNVDFMCIQLKIGSYVLVFTKSFFHFATFYITDVYLKVDRCDV